MKASNEAGKDKPEKQCNFVHYEAESGRCTSFTTKECKKEDGEGYDTVKAEGMVVMTAYFEDSQRRKEKNGDKARRL